MKENKKLIITGLVAVATIASVTGVSAHNSESREAIKAAIEANSYSTFQEVAADSRISETINSEEKFNQLVEAQELKEAGNTEAAQEIRDELGLKKGKGGNKNPEVKAAIEANDYAAFQAAAGGSRKAEKIDTAEKFAQLVEIHALREAGDNEAAKALKEELGIGHGDRDGNKDGGRHSKGQNQ